MKTSPCRKLAPAGSSPDPIMMPNVEHPGHQSCCDLMLLLSTPEDSVSLAVWSSPHLCSIEVTPYDLRDHKDSKIFIFQPSKWNCQSHPLHVFNTPPPKKKHDLRCTAQIQVCQHMPIGETSHQHLASGGEIHMLQNVRKVDWKVESLHSFFYRKWIQIQLRKKPVFCNEMKCSIKEKWW